MKEGREVFDVFFVKRRRAAFERARVVFGNRRGQALGFDAKNVFGNFFLFRKCAANENIRSFIALVNIVFLSLECRSEAS